MSVLFDIQGVQSPVHGGRGIARYLRELALALARRNPSPVSRYLLNPTLPIPGSLEPLLSTCKVSFLDRPGAGDEIIYHVGSPSELTVSLDGIWPLFARRRGLRLVVTVYDLIPEIFADEYLALTEPRLRYRSRLGLLQQADRILAISDSTAHDVIDTLGISPDRVITVGAGVGELFRPPRSRSLAFDTLQGCFPWLEASFILYTGGNEFRKNIDRLLVAYSALPDSVRRAHQLVIVCEITPDARASFDARLERLRIRERVRFVGFVPDDQLILFYQACGLFVFPSLYEGFGLPVAEALACGAPASVARTSSLIELVRDEAALFDPYETRSIRDAIQRCLAPSLNAKLRQESAGRGLTWDAVADRTATVYADLATRRRCSRPPRKGLAYVSPLPPQRSGVADYSYRLLEALSVLCPCDVYVDGLRSPGKSPTCKVRTLSQLEAIERLSREYDTILYCLGNSEFHADTLAMLRRRPGVVIAHDVRLTGLYAWRCQHRTDSEEQRFPDLVRSMHRSRLPASLGDLGHLSWEESDAYGILMAREAIALSERYIVHSNYAAQIATLDAPIGHEHKIKVMPFAAPDPDCYSRITNSGPPVVATFGHVAAIKQTEKVLEAFLRTPAVHKNAELAIVGPISDGDRVLFERRISASDQRTRVHVTGVVTDWEYRFWLTRAAVAVQLRAASNGESSAAVMECLAAGVPTIVTGLGSARELPDSCVVKVERDISAEALGGEVANLLSDERRRGSLSSDGIAYAREHSFERSAEALLELIESR